MLIDEVAVEAGDLGPAQVAALEQRPRRRPGRRRGRRRSMRSIAGKRRYGAGTGSSSTTRTRLPSASSASASASCDPIASPSGRAWDVRMNDCRARGAPRRRRCAEPVHADPSVPSASFDPPLPGPRRLGTLRPRALALRLRARAGCARSRSWCSTLSVELEAQLGHAAQPDPAADLPAQERRRALERARRLLARLLVAQHACSRRARAAGRARPSRA